MNIKDLQKQAYKTAKEKGWHDGARTIGDMIALCHSELSEALEEVRETPPHLLGFISYTRTEPTAPLEKPEGFAIELADVLIRVADMAELLGVNLTEALSLKMEYNKTRPHRHGGKRL